MERKKVVYIAGPITGVAKYWEPFERAEDEILAKGWVPLSPAHHPVGLTNEAYTRLNMAMIDVADAVLFLRNSTRSKGALLEYQYCKYINKPTAHTIEGLKGVLG